MSAEAGGELDQIVHECVRELIDFCGLLELEQELWQTLAECGLPHERIPILSADMIARALARIGDEHKQLARDIDAEEAAGSAPPIPD